MMLGLVAAAGLAGIAEAGVLVLVVRAALAVTGESNDSLAVPFTSIELSAGAMLWCAFALALLGLGLNVLLARMNADMSTRVLANARRRAIESFVSASWERQALDREGALQETVMTLSQQSSQLALVFVTGATGLVNLIALLAVAAVLDFLTMVIVIGFGLCLFAALRPIARTTRNRAQLFVDSNSAFAEETSRVATSAMELRVFGVQESAAKELSELNTVAADFQRRTRFAGQLGSTLYRDLAFLFLIAAVAALGAVNDDAVASVSAVVLLVLRALTSAQVVHIARQRLNEDGPYLEVLYNRLGSLERAAATFGDRSLESVDSIEFDHVTYEYEPGSPALNDITLQINRGEVLGVVGPSGGGKSTFVQVLLRLRLPTTGTVAVNGQDYQTFDPTDWAGLTSLVPQEPRLMEAPIIANIRFFRSGISSSDVLQAAEDAHVLHDIVALDQGFETRLGPRGGGLSGGQKQRVAIARALVGKPQLLVLDEPTSALDVHSERLLQETIVRLKGTATIVIVAHRLTTLKSCDRILVLRDGSVEMIGSPTELLSTPGFFQSVSSSLEEDTKLVT